jgi:hypothetical protein
LAPLGAQGAPRAGAVNIFYHSSMTTISDSYTAFQGEILIKEYLRRLVSSYGTSQIYFIAPVIPLASKATLSLLQSSLPTTYNSIGATLLLLGVPWPHATIVYDASSVQCSSLYQDSLQNKERGGASDKSSMFMQTAENQMRDGMKSPTSYQ